MEEQHSFGYLPNRWLEKGQRLSIQQSISNGGNAAVGMIRQSEWRWDEPLALSNISVKRGLVSETKKSWVYFIRVTRWRLCWNKVWLERERERDVVLGCKSYLFLAQVCYKMMHSWLLLLNGGDFLHYFLFSLLILMDCTVVVLMPSSTIQGRPAWLRQCSHAFWTTCESMDNGHHLLWDPVKQARGPAPCSHFVRCKSIGRENTS